ncbi:MAG: hypothetical protein JRH15_15870 [Deltaproteobacteria bacterium]|nr:hypothetical protein [Deltaproteobacteria bacterium]
MRKLILEKLPNGMDLVKEGVEIGKTIDIGSNRFEKERNTSFFEWFITETVDGRIRFNPEIGLKTLDETAQAAQWLYDEAGKRGIDIGVMTVISNWLNALPPDIREKAPKGTSFMLDAPEDFGKMANASPIMAAVGDHMISGPNSVENTINALRGGITALGTVSQFSWRYPYWDDEVTQMEQVVKAMGIVAANTDKGVSLSTYMGDGFPGSFADRTTVVGYALLEQYIAQTLCGAPYFVSMGGLMSHLPNKYATMLAIDEVGRIDGMPCMGHIEGNTISATEDFGYNYGIQVADFMMYALIERKHQIGTVYNPKPVSEAIRVPTVNEILDVTLACHGAMERVKEIEEAGLFDDTGILEIKDVLVREGKKFYENAMNGLPDLGVDTTDPLQMLLGLRRLGAPMLEEMFHPGKKDPSRFHGIVPFVETDLIRKYRKVADQHVGAFLSQGLDKAVKDKTIVVGSADTHEFGLWLTEAVLTGVGARVVNGGVDMDPEAFLDIARREKTPYVAVSVHNGQCMAWGNQLVVEANKRHQEIKPFMGGILNTMVDTSPEPVDATEMLKELGITPCEDVFDLAGKIN